MKPVGRAKPKDAKKALMHLLTYIGHHKCSMAVIAVLVCISAVSSIAGTYLLKPVINDYGFMGLIYLFGATSCLLYNRMMVRVSQRVVGEIRMDLFRNTQKLTQIF